MSREERRGRNVPPRPWCEISMTNRVELGRQVSSAVCGEVRNYCSTHDVSLTYILTKSGVTGSTFKRWERRGVRYSQVPTALALLAVIKKCLVIDDL